MDKFEKYIRTHKEAFDSEEPNDLLWEKIAAKLDEKQPAQKQVRLVPITKLWQMAAVFTGLIVCMIGFQIYYNSQNKQKTIAKIENAGSISLESIYPELAEAEQFYFMQIEQKRQELKKYNNLAGTKTDSETEEYLSELDKAYKDLKKELNTNSNELVISEMVRNLQIRIDLLNQQLEVLKQIEKMKEEQKGKTL
jgi:lipopolysaccharide export LptBFGC system permease protein LptF